MRNLSDPDYIAKLIRASQVMNPVYIEIHEGAYAKSDEMGYCYYGGMSLIIEGTGTPLPPTKVTVDPPKAVPAKKPKNRTPRTRRLKNPAILKNGTILLKDREPERP